LSCDERDQNSFRWETGRKVNKKKQKERSVWGEETQESKPPQNPTEKQGRKRDKKEFKNELSVSKELEL